MGCSRKKLGRLNHSALMSLFISGMLRLTSPMNTAT